MTEMIFYDTLRQGLWISVLISTPVLGTALLAGVSIGLLQALTSIQEMTLTFVPKLAAIVVVFWATMGFMAESLTAYFQNELLPVVGGI
ncbi:MAG: flagellar biosynthetic protein FliQ [Pseudomonadota bacterium]